MGAESKSGSGGCGRGRIRDVGIAIARITDRNSLVILGGGGLRLVLKMLYLSPCWKSEKIDLWPLLREEESVSGDGGEDRCRGEWGELARGCEEGEGEDLESPLEARLGCERDGECEGDRARVWEGDGDLVAS